MVFALPPVLAALAHAQRGLLTRAQARDAGLSDKTIDCAVRAQRWQRLGFGLYATFTGDLLPDQRAWAAVLAAGPGAVLSHDTAAFHHGLVQHEPDSVHVCVPYSCGRAGPTGVVLHRSRVERHVSGRPPTTEPPDTLCDLAAAGATGDPLAAMVSRAVQARLVDPAEVIRAVERRGRGNRGSGELLRLVQDAQLGAHSALEMRYLREVERRHGLPRGERQHRVRRNGRTTYRDVFYADYGLVIELDGKVWHGGLAERVRDLGRDLAAATAGEVTLRIGWWDVAGSSCESARYVAGILATLGWAGRPRVCRSCA